MNKESKLETSASLDYIIYFYIDEITQVGD